MSTKKLITQNSPPAITGNASEPDQVPFVTELEESQALVAKQAAQIAELEATVEATEATVKQLQEAFTEARAENDALEKRLEAVGSLAAAIEQPLADEHAALHAEISKLTTALERSLRFRAGKDLDFDRFEDGDFILTIQGTCLAVQKKARTHDRLPRWQLVECLIGDFSQSGPVPDAFVPLRLPRREPAAE